jgi:hypothetical protein
VELFENLFASGMFIPHGHCYLWKPELVWLHVVSDLSIAIAYYSIPIALVYFVASASIYPSTGYFCCLGHSSLHVALPM